MNLQIVACGQILPTSPAKPEARIFMNGCMMFTRRLPLDQKHWHAQILLQAPLPVQHPMTNSHCHMREMVADNTA